VGDGLAIYGTATGVTVDTLGIYRSGDDAVDLDGSLGTITLNNLDIAEADSDAYEFDGVTITNLSGTGNTSTDAGNFCSAAGATITGSITDDTATCP
jgi:hypothetical protein